MELYIDNRQDKVELGNGVYEILEEIIEECLLLEGRSLNYEISLSFVDNEEIKKVKQRI